MIAPIRARCSLDVRHDGGLWVLAGDSAYVVLPGHFSTGYRKSSRSPPTRRHAGGVPHSGQVIPCLAKAANRVLAATPIHLDRPAAVRPGRDVLQAEVREAFPARPGRIDLSGEPAWCCTRRAGGGAGRRAVGRGPLPGGGGALGGCLFPSRSRLVARLDKAEESVKVIETGPRSQLLVKKWFGGSAFGWISFYIATRIGWIRAQRRLA